MSFLLLMVFSRFSFYKKCIILTNHILFIEYGKPSQFSDSILSYLLSLFYILAVGILILKAVFICVFITILWLYISRFHQHQCFLPLGFLNLACNWPAFDLLPQIEREPYLIDFWISDIGHSPILHLAHAQKMLVDIKCNRLKMF